MNSHLPEPTRADDSRLSSELARLQELLLERMQRDGLYESGIPGLHLFRSSEVAAHPEPVLYFPALCIVAQGAKRLMTGDGVVDYDPSTMLVVTLDIPVSARIISATETEPYLTVRLDFDRSRVGDLALRAFPDGIPAVDATAALSFLPADAKILNAVNRLLELSENADELALLAPLFVDEILLRLLRTSAGLLLTQLGDARSNINRIAKAVAWVRANFAENLNVDDLAKSAHMSASTFHYYFKHATAMTPLQYQKLLRMQEARRLLLTTAMDVGTVARSLGYASASQFSREYRRQFGDAPSHDIAQLRERYRSDS